MTQSPLTSADREAILEEELSAWDGRKVVLRGDTWAVNRLTNPGLITRIRFEEGGSDGLPYLISVDHFGGLALQQVRWRLRDLSVVTCKQTGASIALNASQPVRRFVRIRGGEVFLWLQPSAGHLVRERVSLQAPVEGPAFDEFDAGDFMLHIESGFYLPYGVGLRIRRWPRQALIAITRVGGYAGGDVPPSA